MSMKQSVKFLVYIDKASMNLILDVLCDFVSFFELLCRELLFLGFCRYAL